MSPADDLIAAIYESAALPELWPTTLDRLAAVVECDKALMFTTDGARVQRWVCNEAMRPGMEVFLRDRWMERNPQGAHVITYPEPAFKCDDDLFSPEEIETLPYYREFLRPNGMAWGTGTMIEGGSADMAIVSIHRPYECGPIERARMAELTRLRPHLARATLVSARLANERHAATLSALENLGLPAATLSPAGRLIDANAVFGTQAGDEMVDLPGRLRFRDREADRLFQTMLDTPQATGASFPHRAGEHRPPFIVHVSPIAGHGRDLFAAARWLLILTPPAAGKPVSARMLAGLFDLTPAESRVVVHLLQGAGVGGAAEGTATTPETVRHHLKSVFYKTGTHSQGELLALLHGLRPSPQQ
ncbi:helix-turn-helix transcriptional regulator [Ancylobacter sp. A5.8]|uniref:helix-turn-helix transcriptional regulator n=1 Tax=Ancylobacter gelatini TaxID=2919920 RepID=UPI001F4D6003|nr:helix-turn-helix transcriptional regulator [Ancylobacter gelatini]MCJ8143097.1 helix-turn-helix transcriptional regulator [Ancylobacter gelatini]